MFCDFNIVKVAKLLGLCPRPRWGSLQRSPIPHAGKAPPPLVSSTLIVSRTPPSPDQPTGLVQLRVRGNNRFNYGQRWACTSITHTCTTHIHTHSSTHTCTTHIHTHSSTHTCTTHIHTHSSPRPYPTVKQIRLYSICLHGHSSHHQLPPHTPHPPRFPLPPHNHPHHQSQEKCHHC